jgi:tetratricopeptide (TPR) repeat protein
MLDDLRVKSHKAMADTLTELAFACYQLHLADEGIGYSQQSMEHYREAGNAKGECSALNELAKVYELMLKTPEAIEHYHEALTLAQEIADTEAEQTARMSLFRIYTELHAFDEARKYLAGSASPLGN